MAKLAEWDVNDAEPAVAWRRLLGVADHADHGLHWGTRVRSYLAAERIVLAEKKGRQRSIEHDSIRWRTRIRFLEATAVHQRHPHGFEEARPYGGRCPARPCQDGTPIGGQFLTAANPVIATLQ